MAGSQQYYVAMYVQAHGAPPGSVRQLSLHVRLAVDIGSDIFCNATQQWGLEYVQREACDPPEHRGDLAHDQRTWHIPPCSSQAGP